MGADSEPVLACLSMNMQWLQVGDEHDLSFVHNPLLTQKLQQMAVACCRSARTLRSPSAGTGARPLSRSSLPPGGNWPGTGCTIPLARHSRPPTWRRIFTICLPARWSTWTSLIRCPPRGTHLPERVVDLVRKMIAVRQSSVEAAYVTRLFDQEQGLFDPVRGPTNCSSPGINWRPPSPPSVGSAISNCHGTAGTMFSRPIATLSWCCGMTSMSSRDLSGAGRLGSGHLGPPGDSGNR